jgi:hypothetical protein
MNRPIISISDLRNQHGEHTGAIGSDEFRPFLLGERYDALAAGLMLPSSHAPAAWNVSLVTFWRPLPNEGVGIASRGVAENHSHAQLSLSDDY